VADDFISFQGRRNKLERAIFPAKLGTEIYFMLSAIGFICLLSMVALH